MPKAVSSNTKANRWRFVIYNYEPWGTPWAWLQPMCSKFNITYYCIGEEICPNTGRPHLQGYLELGNGSEINDRKKLQTMKGLLKASGCKNKTKLAWWKEIHWDTCDGTPLDNIRYCSKTREGDTPNEVVHIWGTPMPPENVLGSRERKRDKHQGERTDLDFAKDLVAEGKVTDYKSAWATRGLSCQASALLLAHLARTEPESRGQTVVFWLHGETGSDKSRLSKWAKQQFADRLGWSTYSCGTSSKWFDGYDDDEVAIIDDHRATHWEFSLLLRLLDRYPVMVEVKGGRVWWRPKVIIITSPVPHTQSYESLPRFDGDVSQLTRRIHGDHGGEYLLAKGPWGDGDALNSKQQFRLAVDRLCLDSIPEIPIPVPVVEDGDAAGPGGSGGDGGPLPVDTGARAELVDPVHSLPQTQEIDWADPAWSLGFEDEFNFADRL